MKKLTTLLIPFLVLMVSCSDEFSSSQSDHITEIFDEIHISDETNLYSDPRGNPVSGHLTSFFDDETRQTDLNFENGMISSGFIWSEDGVLRMKYRYEDGYYKQTILNEDGQPVAEFLFDDNPVSPAGAATWFDDGTLSLQSNREISRMWHENGQLKMESELIDGKIDGKVIAWHDNGKIAAESHFKNDKQHGTFKEWDQEGNLISKKVYETGMPAGPQLTWDSDGNLIEEKMYQDGKPHGTHKKWDSDGNLLEKRLFEDGSIVTTRTTGR
ncbi:MAG: toxin-antitoxin system YwqK family antitoxin [Balneolaceae bacterium]|nr:toxin-antitoxin system YwqK family antitoxin [Balneolaceae bacterium]